MHRCRSLPARARPPSVCRDPLRAMILCQRGRAGHFPGVRRAPAQTLPERFQNGTVSYRRTLSSARTLSCAEIARICGVFRSGARRDRTVDLLLAKQALSQLSYGPSDEIVAAADSPVPPRTGRACGRIPASRLSREPFRYKIVTNQQHPRHIVARCANRAAARWDCVTPRFITWPSRRSSAPSRPSRWASGCSGRRSRSMPIRLVARCSSDWSAFASFRLPWPGSSRPSSPTATGASGS